MAWSLGDRAAVVIRIRVQTQREGGVNRLHILDRLVARVLGRTDRRDCVVEVRVAVVSVSHDQIGRWKARIVPGKGVGMIEVEDQPRHHPTAVDLHVGIADCVIARTYQRSGLVVAATCEIRRLDDDAVKCRTVLGETRRRRVCPCSGYV